MKYSGDRALKRELYMASNTRAAGGDNDNLGIVREIAELRLTIAQLLGYPSWAAYSVEERMAKTPAAVEAFLQRLLEPSLPAARRELDSILAYAARWPSDSA